MSGVRDIPAEVEIHEEPRPPVEDPTLGIAVPQSEPRAARHRLVTVGDSLTEGFMSAAVYRTDLSWPAIAAFEMGLSSSEFTYPTYEWPHGPGGLPLDLERLARAFEKRYGAKLDFWEIVGAGLWVQSYLDDIEDYWERGEGAETPAGGPPFHNMAVYGWDLLDPQLLTAATISARLSKRPRDDLLDQLVENNMDRAAWPVLQRARKGNRGRSVLDAVADMSKAPEGIETLVVMLGSNNALGSVVTLEPAWTPDGYDQLEPRERLAARAKRNLWRPSAFAADWALLEARLRTVRAQHVVVATVPAVTIPPITRGVHRKMSPRSRYFPYYTRPWISDDDFDPRRDPHITALEARAIDSAIDAFNATIIASVERARLDGLDWYLFDMGALLDRLASRRYLESPWARPPWWTPYPLPAALRDLDPAPNTRFFRSGPQGRTDGGLFSLDGVHPTTIGYGILAQEVIRIMELAGVEFRDRQGLARGVPVDVDFRRLVELDTLVSTPPAAISSSLSLLGWLDDTLDWVTRFLPFVRSPL